jgi:hypothetical protein
MRVTREREEEKARRGRATYETPGKESSRTRPITCKRNSDIFKTLTMEVVYGSDLPQVGVSKESAHMSKMAIVINVRVV